MQFLYKSLLGNILLHWLSVSFSVIIPDNVTMVVDIKYTFMNFANIGYIKKDSIDCAWTNGSEW